MRKHLAAARINQVVVVHTCAVTSEAERQARQAIRRARRANPGARIIVTGCSAQISPDRYQSMAEVDHVIGNREKLDRRQWAKLGQVNDTVSVGNIMEDREAKGSLVNGFKGRSRGFVQVQNGCDHRCTFCVIPYGRGNSRSIELMEVVQQAEVLKNTGYQEVVVTGVDITSYGKDLPGAPTLGQLVKMILAQVPTLARLRLSSIDPAEVDVDLRELIANEPRLMPHLHLSVQSGDDLILKRMKRRHSRQDVIDLCRDLRALRSDIVFGADIIAGFPTENTTMHQKSLDLVDEAGITHLHVFPYSERPGTPAARMPSVRKVIRKERAAELREAGDRALRRYLETRLGQRESVLLERSGSGHTEGFAVCDLGVTTEDMAGHIVEAEVTGIDSGRLIGRMMQ